MNVDRGQKRNHFRGQLVPVPDSGSRDAAKVVPKLTAADTMNANSTVTMRRFIGWINSQGQLLPANARVNRAAEVDVEYGTGVDRRSGWTH